MITIYGMLSCPDCSYVESQVTATISFSSSISALMSKT